MTIEERMTAAGMDPEGVQAWDRVNIMIRPEVKKRFAIRCLENDETMTDVLMRAVMEYLGKSSCTK